MIFGGIQKNSLIDYPGKLSCVLFTIGCNFVCPYCHNAGLVRADAPFPQRLSEDAVFDFLAGRTRFLEGVVITGGEPTLHPELGKVCRRIRSLGYPVKLDTNGSRPKVLERLIQGNRLDCIAMDVKTDPAAYAPHIWPAAQPSDILKSIALIKASGLPHEFRTTCVKTIVTSQAVDRIADIIQGADGYALQQFQPENVLKPEFFSGRDLRYSAEELQQLKAVVGDRVKTCVIR